MPRNIRPIISMRALRTMSHTMVVIVPMLMYHHYISVESRNTDNKYLEEKFQNTQLKKEIEYKNQIEKLNQDLEHSRQRIQELESAKRKWF